MRVTVLPGVLLAVLTPPASAHVSETSGPLRVRSAIGKLLAVEPDLPGDDVLRVGVRRVKEFLGDRGAGRFVRRGGGGGVRRVLRPAEALAQSVEHGADDTPEGRRGE